MILTGSNVGSLTSYFSLDANTIPLVRQTVTSTPWLHTSGTYAAGSQVLDQTTSPNTMYQTFANGNTWIAGNLAAFVAAPTSSGQSCAPGTFAYGTVSGTNYFFACEPTGNWGRTALTTY